MTKALKTMAEAVQLRRERAAERARSLARALSAGAFPDAPALLARADEAGVDLDALAAELDRRLAAAEAVASARRQIDMRLRVLVSDEQREKCRASIVRDALLPLLGLVPEKAVEIQVAATTAVKIESRFDRARDEARLPSVAAGDSPSRVARLEGYRRRVTETPRNKPAVDGSTCPGQRERAEAELAAYEALLADVERLPELEAEHARAVARVDRLRAEAFVELEREFCARPSL